MFICIILYFSMMVDMIVIATHVFLKKLNKNTVCVCVFKEGLSI
jgi:hypothetical protein